jgi:hypothetical protein
MLMPFESMKGSGNVILRIDLVCHARALSDATRPTRADSQLKEKSEGDDALVERQLRDMMTASYPIIQE